MNLNDNIGRIVVSKAGRDNGKLFIIVGILDENYVYISDGGLRSIDKPKKKKIKHLIFKDTIATEFNHLLISGGKVSNSEVRKFLQSVDSNKEV